MLEIGSACAAQRSASASATVDRVRTGTAAILVTIARIGFEPRSGGTQGRRRPDRRPWIRIHWSESTGRGRETQSDWIYP